jgi:general secretion pathway protein B
VGPAAAVAPVPAQVQVQPQATLSALEAKSPPVPVQKPELPLRAPVPAPVAAPASTLQTAASTVAHVQAKVAPPPASPVLPVAAAASIEASSKPAPVAVPIRSASGGVPMLSELPEPMRRQIPALNISGAVYSDSPPEWTLIINDQLIGKGGQVAPDVRLEEVSASSAVFNYKGQRFRMER